MILIVPLIVLGIIAWACLAGANAIKKRWERRSQEIIARYRPNVVFCREEFLGFRFEDRLLFVGNMTEAYQYGFDQLTKCELLKDEVPIHTVDRGGQLGAALVGGALLGPVGALIGGLSASKETRVNIKRLSLKLVIDDPVKPAHEVVFFAAPGKGQKPGMLSKRDTELAEMFYGHCLNAMRPDDREETKAVAFENA